VLVILSTGAGLRAQSVLDRRVGLERRGVPIVVERIDDQTIGRLALAAGVPMGFEVLASGPRGFKLTASGKTLNQLLGEIVALDPRYEWREIDGVIVLRPINAWSSEGLLESRVDRVALPDVSAAEVMTYLQRLLGHADSSAAGPGDTSRFSIELPAGATLMDVLNATVRAHGTLAWSLSSKADAEDEFPRTISLFIGASGYGFGIRRDAVVKSSAPAPGRIDRTTATLDRRVGMGRNGQPLVVRGFLGQSSALNLASAAQVPIGFESLPADAHRIDRQEDVALTGMRLADALNVLVAMDPRYEWREFDGVVVLRPSIAWNDPYHPLFKVVTNVKLDDVPAFRAMQTLLKALGGSDRSAVNFPDTRRVSVHVAQGSVLDLINAIVRSHGEMSWHWQERTAKGPARFASMRHTLMFHFGGSGRGFDVP
jgi:hypothetical protein